MYVTMFNSELSCCIKAHVLEKKFELFLFLKGKQGLA